jgi:hypothetical protein
MRRFLVLTSVVCAAAALPASLYAQNAAVKSETPAVETQAAQTPAAAPKVGFTAPSGLLLVQIKPDQTAAFEEMVGKINAGLAKAEDATLKQQAAGFKVYKSSEPFGQNALYVVIVEPTVAGAEYDPFAILTKTMTAEELRSPDIKATWDKYSGAFAAALGRLNLTPVK